MNSVVVSPHTGESDVKKYVVTAPAPTALAPAASNLNDAIIAQVDDLLFATKKLNTHQIIRLNSSPDINNHVNSYAIQSIVKNQR